MNSKFTKTAFLLGAGYFVCMGLAHFFGLKLPLLFVYYDTPFYAYQDKIISFAVFAYVALFYLASKHRDAALLAIMVLGLTALGLSGINISKDLQSVLAEHQSTLPYWLQTVAIAGYVVALAWLYIRDGKVR